MPPLRLRDGGGLGSDADWANPREPDSFQALRMQWWARIMDWNLSERLWQHVRDTSRKPLLSDVEISLLRHDLSFKSWKTRSVHRAYQSRVANPLHWICCKAAWSLVQMLTLRCRLSLPRVFAQAC